MTLLDVREPHEHEAASIDGSIDIPMAEVAARIGEIDRDRPVVVMCRIGGRSMVIARLLAAQGFEQIFNMTGGIEAWPAKLDAAPHASPGGPHKQKDKQAS